MRHLPYLAVMVALLTTGFAHGDTDNAHKSSANTETVAKAADTNTSAPANAASCVPASSKTPSGPKPARPNVIIFLTDDLGYADLGVQGIKDVPTPHIDSLAHQGVRFTSGYVTCPVCAPTRAALLTGRYQQRYGFERVNGAEVTAVPHYGVPLEERMLSEYLKEAGYVTGMVGKWNLGFKPEFTPPQRGFDFFFGFLSGYHGYYPDKPAPWAGPIVRGTQPVEEKEYLTDAFGREAVSFIQQNAGKPFFLYVPFNAVHSPLEAPPELEERFASIAQPGRRRMAAMISSMDCAVGRVLDTLRQKGVLDNTLIFFLSDNGGAGGTVNSGNGPLRGFKCDLYEGGIRVPFLMQWKAHVPAGKVVDQPVVCLDILPTVLAAAGITAPEKARLDGVNLLPFVRGEENEPPHKTLYWRYLDQRPWKAIRQGDWKLASHSERWELYNLAQDLGEKNDLSTSAPEKVKELESAWLQWNAQMQDPKWETRQPPRRPEPPRK